MQGVFKTYNKGLQQQGVFKTYNKCLQHAGRV